MQQKTSPLLLHNDKANLETTALKTPVCATYGRYNFGPKMLLIAGPGIAWKYSYVNHILTKLENGSQFTGSRLSAIGFDYIIQWQSDYRTYRLFNLKKMKWSKEIRHDHKIGQMHGIVPIHISFDVCSD